MEKLSPKSDNMLSRIDRARDSITPYLRPAHPGDESPQVIARNTLLAKLHGLLGAARARITRLEQIPAKPDLRDTVALALLATIEHVDPAIRYAEAYAQADLFLDARSEVPPVVGASEDLLRQARLEISRLNAKLGAVSGVARGAESAVQSRIAAENDHAHELGVAAHRIAELEDLLVRCIPAVGSNESKGSCNALLGEIAKITGKDVSLDLLP